jgi:hypothetical protein
MAPPRPPRAVHRRVVRPARRGAAAAASAAAAVPRRFRRRFDDGEWDPPGGRLRPPPPPAVRGLRRRGEGDTDVAGRPRRPLVRRAVRAPPSRPRRRGLGRGGGVARRATTVGGDRRRLRRTRLPRPAADTWVRGGVHRGDGAELLEPAREGEGGRAGIAVRRERIGLQVRRRRCRERCWGGRSDSVSPD